MVVSCVRDELMKCGYASKVKHLPWGSYGNPNRTGSSGRVPGAVSHLLDSDKSWLLLFELDLKE